LEILHGRLIERWHALAEGCSWVNKDEAIPLQLSQTRPTFDDLFALLDAQLTFHYCHYPLEIHPNSLEHIDCDKNDYNHHECQANIFSLGVEIG
jgi:hypothetical protein